MKDNGKFSGSLVLLVILLASLTVAAQVQQQSGQQAMQQGAADDPIRQLNLTAEQREQIRSIREQSKPERVAINQRLADANRALEVALDAEDPDEAVVEQRLREVSAAQAAAARMRILTEVRIRRVLTPEQRLTLRSLQKQARETRRERQENNAEKRQIRRQERIEGLRNQRNGMGPILQRPGAQRRPRI